MPGELLSPSRKPRLSVFLPNYNHGHMVGQAIEAIMTQSRPPDELLVIDDASTDHSVAVIEQLQQRYPVTRLVRHSKNKGVLQIMSWVVDELRGDYLYGAAADDRVQPGFFAAAMVSAEQYPEAGIICGEIIIHDDHGRRVGYARAARWREDQYVPPERFFREYVSHELPSHSLSGATIFRRAALQELGGFAPELSSWADSFAVRALGLKYGAVYLARPGMTWILHRNSVSNQSSRSPRQMLTIIARAQARMREPRFRALFPEAHVRAWGHRYRLLVMVQWLVSRLPWSAQMQLHRSPLVHYVKIVLAGRWGKRV